MNLTFTFKTQLWLYSGKGAWHFVTLPNEAAAEIKFFPPSAKGFMPIPVKATIGETTWKTSVFPDSKSGSYLLAVKAEVRKKEGIAAGEEVTVWVAVT
jgi:Domain of unknown function (DUF1905)